MEREGWAHREEHVHALKYILSEARSPPGFVSNRYLCRSRESLSWIFLLLCNMTRSICSRIMYSGFFCGAAPETFPWLLFVLICCEEAPWITWVAEMPFGSCKAFQRWPVFEPFWSLANMLYFNTVFTTGDNDLSLPCSFSGVLFPPGDYLK